MHEETFLLQVKDLTFVTKILLQTGSLCAMVEYD